MGFSWNGVQSFLLKLIDFSSEIPFSALIPWVILGYLGWVIYILDKRMNILFFFFSRNRVEIILDMQWYYDYETISRVGLESIGQNPSRWNTHGTLSLCWTMVIKWDFRHNLLLLAILERAHRVKDQVKVLLPNPEAKRESRLHQGWWWHCHPSSIWTVHSTDPQGLPKWPRMWGRDDLQHCGGHPPSGGICYRTRFGSVL